LQLTLSNKAVVTVLDAERFIYETGGDPVVTGTAGVNYSTFNDFTSSVFGKSVPGDDSTIVQAGGVVIQADGSVTNQNVVITGTVSGVTGVKENFVWSQSNAVGHSTLTNFGVTEDAIQFDLAGTQQTTMTLDKLNGYSLSGGDVISISQDQVEENTIIGLGNDSQGKPLALTLVGVNDASQVDVSVI
jgi:hypothetical protein